MWQQLTYQDSTDSCPYFVYTPLTHRARTRVPLVVMLHGCTQTAADFAAGTRMNQLAEQNGFIVMYPQQLRKYNRTLCWNWFKSANQFRDQGEPAMIAGMVRAVTQNTAQWTIDSKRVYVAGASAGAAMAVILGASYPDIFAAIGVHSGVEYRPTTNVVSALTLLRRGGPDPEKQGNRAYDAMGHYKRVVPVIVIQGNRDRVVPPVNGDQVIQQWMQTNRLASQGLYAANFNKPSSTTSGTVLQGHAYTVYRWKDSKGNDIQEYWKVHELGHAWSGGSPSGSYTDPQGPNASEAMYRFFMKHSMSAATASHHEPSLWEDVKHVLSDSLERFREKK